MSSETIKAFFKGTFSDEMITSPRSFEYRVTDKKEVEAYQKLRSQLAGETLKLFDEFVNLSGECQAMEVENYYIRGFKFGLRLAMECLDLSDVIKEK